MPCVRCGTEFQPRKNGGKPQRYCSGACRKKAAVEALLERDPDYYRRAYRENKDRWEGYEAKARAKPGVREKRLAANRQWHQDNPEKVTELGRKWRKANPEKVRQHARKRYARKRDATVEEFDELEIFERDGWICQKCFEPVDSSLTGPHPKSKSLDHKRPISMGGAHSRENSQLLHFGCNSAKGNRYSD